MNDVPRDPGAAEELDSLLGAYALDALDADERARVDSYLEHDDAVGYIFGAFTIADAILSSGRTSSAAPRRLAARGIP